MRVAHKTTELDKSMIFLTGATGTTGKEIVRLLSARSIPARAMVRDIAKAGPLQDAGLDVVVGDLNDPASLPHALRWTSRVLRNL